MTESTPTDSQDQSGNFWTIPSDRRLLGTDGREVSDQSGTYPVDWELWWRDEDNVWRRFA